MSTETETAEVRIVRQGFTDLPTMGEAGSIANADDVYANPGGSDLCSGFFELLHSKPLYFEYEYDEMKIVLEGELIVHEGRSDKTVRAQQFDVLFIPNGSKVTFSTPTRALAFYACQRPSAA